MMRGFNAHRRYSITHRAVQRLRELVPTVDDHDDEQLRDRLDRSLGEAEDADRAIRTLDAMLGEPQTLIPVDEFEETLYAIIKEDTVVTVLPKGHGEEIIQRGLALEQRVRDGEVKVPDREERWEMRRRWRREAQSPAVFERSAGSRVAPSTEPSVVRRPAAAPAPEAVAVAVPKVVRMRPSDQVGAALFDALEAGERKAVVAALRETIVERGPEAKLLPLWNEMAATSLPAKLTIGDLRDALAALD
jgi:hypothetical protein